MKKKLLASMLVLFCTVDLVACAVSDTEELGDTDSVSQEEGLHNWDFPVTIDGTVYQLPMKYSEFKSLGWTYEGDYIMLSPKQESELEYWEKDGCTIYTHFYNFSEDIVSVYECWVVSIWVDEFWVENSGLDVTLPGNIRCGVSTIEDIKEAYGEPDDEYDYSFVNEYELTYKNDHHQKISLYVSTETGTLTEFDLEIGDNSVDTTVPEEVLNYMAPTELGDDLYSNNIILEDELYTLPCPVSELLDNGFSLVEEESDMEIEDGGSGYVTLSYKGQTCRWKVKNYSNYNTIVENCFITYAVCGDEEEGADYELIIPGNIKCGSSEEDVLRALENFNYEYSDDYYYVYNPEKDLLDRNNLEIEVKDGLVNSIRIHTPLKY